MIPNQVAKTQTLNGAYRDPSIPLAMPARLFYQLVAPSPLMAVDCRLRLLPCLCPVQVWLFMARKRPSNRREVALGGIFFPRNQTEIDFLDATTFQVQAKENSACIIDGLANKKEAVKSETTGDLIRLPSLSNLTITLQRGLGATMVSLFLTDLRKQ